MANFTALAHTVSQNWLFGPEVVYVTLLAYPSLAINFSVSRRVSYRKLDVFWRVLLSTPVTTILNIQKQEVYSRERLTDQCLFSEINVHPKIGHEGPEGEYVYSFTHSLASAIVANGWSTPCPGRFTPPGKIRYLLYRRLGGTQEKSHTSGIRSPDRPGRSKSPYRLS